MKNIILPVIITLLAVYCCSEKGPEAPDCEILLNGLSQTDEFTVKNEIERLTSDLYPRPTAEDPTGHLANLTILVHRINNHCTKLIASLNCYACVSTFPVTSEILVEYNVDGSTEFMIIDFYTPDKDILRYQGIHPPSLPV